MPVIRATSAEAAMNVTSAIKAASVCQVTSTSITWGPPRLGRAPCSGWLKAVKGPDPLEHPAVECHQLGRDVLVDVAGPVAGAFDVKGCHARLLDLDPQRPVNCRVRIPCPAIARHPTWQRYAPRSPLA